MLRNYTRNQKPNSRRVPSTKYLQSSLNLTLLQGLSTTNKQYMFINTFVCMVIYFLLFKDLAVS